MIRMKSRNPGRVVPSHCSRRSSGSSSTGTSGTNSYPPFPLTGLTVPPQSGDGLEREVGLDDEHEATPPRLLDPDRRAPLVEAPLEEDEPALEVVAELRELERRIEPHLLVGELGSPVTFVKAQQRPQDATGDALDEVLAVEARAPVDREEAHAQRRCTRVPSGAAAAVPLELGVAARPFVGPVDLDRAGDEGRDHGQQRLVGGREREPPGALDHDDADELAQ